MNPQDGGVGWVLVLADSEVAAVRPVDAFTFCIVFSAAQVQRPDPDRRTPWVGHAPGLELVLGGVEAVPSSSGCDPASAWALAQGRLREARVGRPSDTTGSATASTVWRDRLPLPLAWQAPAGQTLCLELQFANGHAMTLRAARLASRGWDPAAVRESLAC